MVEMASENDLKTLVELKIKMFKESGHSDFLAAEPSALIYDYYKKLYNSGNAQHFIIKKENEIISCAGGFIKSDIPFCFMKFILRIYRRRLHSAKRKK